jgi:diguanylate cyclase (GGDEF)-like protein/PAS domain S-box-containing protein
MDTLLLVISNKQDRKLLSDLLSSNYSIIESSRVSENERFFDLCILDAVSLEREWNEISLLRKREDLIFLPFLLLTTRQDIGMSTKNLWQFVDDIIFVPIEKIELQSRLFNLLYARKLSLALKQRDDEILEDNQVRLALAIRSSKIGFLDWDLKENRIWCSHELVEQLGYKEGEIFENFDDWKKIIHLDDRLRVVSEVHNKFANNQTYYETEVRLISKKGDLVYFLVHLSIFYKQEKAIRILASFIDIAERIKAEKKLKYLSYHDHLTGVFNRRYYECMLVELDSAENLPIVVVMGDINGLKQINDTFGHAEGDLLLTRVAKIIMSCCRRDDVVARIGGDEFSIILPQTSELQAREIIRQIKEQMSKVTTQDRTVTMTFGMSFKSLESRKLSDLVVEAENHLFRQKLYETTSVRHDIVNIILNALFEKSNREMKHSDRVGKTCGLIASEMNLNREDTNKIRIAGLVHDIGKIGVSEKTLNKPGKLDEEEWLEIKKHPDAGRRILASIADFADISDYILHHHERWDGRGYPEGLSALEIPLESRIIALADSYDAMIGDRTYRKGMSQEEAIQEIKNQSGKQFDPAIVDIFISKAIPKMTNIQ